MFSINKSMQAGNDRCKELSATSSMIDSRNQWIFALAEKRDHCRHSNYKKPIIKSSSNVNFLLGDAYVTTVMFTEVRHVLMQTLRMAKTKLINRHCVVCQLRCHSSAHTSLIDGLPWVTLNMVNRCWIKPRTLYWCLGSSDDSDVYRLNRYSHAQKQSRAWRRLRTPPSCNVISDGRTLSVTSGGKGYLIARFDRDRNQGKCTGAKVWSPLIISLVRSGCSCCKELAGKNETSGSRGLGEISGWGIVVFFCKTCQALLDTRNTQHDQQTPKIPRPNACECWHNNPHGMTYKQNLWGFPTPRQSKTPNVSPWTHSSI